MLEPDLSRLKFSLYPGPRLSGQALGDKTTLARAYDRLLVTAPSASHSPLPSTGEKPLRQLYSAGRLALAAFPVEVRQALLNHGFTLRFGARFGDVLSLPDIYPPETQPEAMATLAPVLAAQLTGTLPSHDPADQAALAALHQFLNTQGHLPEALVTDSTLRQQGVLCYFSALLEESKSSPIWPNPTGFGLNAVALARGENGLALHPELSSLLQSPYSVSRILSHHIGQSLEALKGPHNPSGGLSETPEFQRALAADRQETPSRRADASSWLYAELVAAHGLGGYTAKNTLLASYPRAARVVRTDLMTLVG